MADDNETQAPPEIVEPVTVFREADGNGVGNLMDHLTDSEIHDVLEAMKSEFFHPMNLSALVVIAFWSIIAHGSLPIFLAVGAGLFFYGTFRRKDIRALSQRKMLDIRMTTLMYVNLAYISVLGALVAPFKYFEASDLQIMRHQIITFFSSFESPLSIPFRIWIKISIQVYWLSLACIVMGRTIANLFIMSTTPQFREILKHESQTQLVAALSVVLGIVGFNYLADYSAHTMPIAMILTVTLVTWIVFCILKSTVLKEEMIILRTNNIDGVLKVITVTMCHVVLCGVFCTAFFLMDDILKNSFSQDTPNIDSEENTSNDFISPINGIIVYFKDVRNNKFETGSGRAIIPWDSESLACLAFMIAISRTVKHLQLIQTLDPVLQQALLNQ